MHPADVDPWATNTQQLAADVPETPVETETPELAADAQERPGSVPGLSSRVAVEVQRVLAGDLSYDAVSAAAQTAVLAAWRERERQLLAELDLTAELQAQGLPWAEADPDGNLVMRYPYNAPDSTERR